MQARVDLWDVLASFFIASAIFVLILPNIWSALAFEGISPIIRWFVQTIFFGLTWFMLYLVAMFVRRIVEGVIG